MNKTIKDQNYIEDVNLHTNWPKIVWDYVRSFKKLGMGKSDAIKMMIIDYASRNKRPL